MNEIWKPVPGFEGYYEVSNLGRVKSLPRKIFYCKGKEKVWKVRDEVILGVREGKYKMVALRGNGKARTIGVHRLVAEVFIPIPPELQEQATKKGKAGQTLLFINHKDENRSNNRVDNLEWCTPQYNTNYGNARQKFQQTLENKRQAQRDIIASRCYADEDGVVRLHIPDEILAEKPVPYRNKRIKDLTRKQRTAYYREMRRWKRKAGLIIP